MNSYCKAVPALNCLFKKYKKVNRYNDNLNKVLKQIVNNDLSILTLAYKFKRFSTKKHFLHAWKERSPKSVRLLRADSTSSCISDVRRTIIDSM